MGTATFQSFVFYIDALSGGQIGSGSAGYTLTDNTPSAPGNTVNNFFEVGESITEGSGVIGDYIGTFTANGVTFVVVQANNDFRLYADEPDISNFPATFTTTDAGGVVATSTIACFLHGTGIDTENGLARVEALRIGDEVLTEAGGIVAVKWIGRQTVSTRFGPADRLRPVRVRAGALGDGVPVRDLTLTADHALLIDGLLINAGALVNGTTIDYVPLSELGESYTVYHIETEAHDVILAEGCPAETYIDYVARRAFDNYDEYVALYGEDRTITEMDHPRISSARQLPTALAARLGISRAA